jgi:amino acid transporter
MAVDQKSDTERLHELGYAQELSRRMGTFSNFAISFSIISILAGAITTYWLGMNAGGPLAITLSWVIVGVFATVIGASMGEICSTYPTAGGLYYWSAKLAKSNAPAWSWFTGWINLIGQIAITASIDYALATFIGFFIQLYDADFELSATNIFVIYCIVLVVHGLLNTFGVRLVALLSDISVWWHVIGVAIIFGFLVFVPDDHQDVSFLFESKNLTGWSFPMSGLYVFGIGILLAQYTITGFDASAHVSEETHDATRGPSKAIVRSIYVSAIAAFFLNAAMTLAIPTDEGAYDNIALGFLTAGPQIFVEAIGGSGAKFLLFISIVGQIFCGMASVTANSRMIYAFSRDGAIPGHKRWHTINPKTRTPTNSVWLAVVAAAILGSSSLIQNDGYSVAFFAIVSIGTVGLYISYAIPIWLRLHNDDFQQGDWNLGKNAKIAGWVSIVWIAIITLLFFAPPFYPWDTLNTFNWSGPLMLIAVGLVAIWWKVSAKKWFKGPQVQGTAEELLAIERDLEAAAGGG